MRKTKPIQAKIPEDLHRELKETAARTGFTISWIIEDSVRRFVGDDRERRRKRQVEAVPGSSGSRGGEGDEPESRAESGGGRS